MPFIFDMDSRTYYDNEWFIAFFGHFTLTQAYGYTNLEILNTPSWSISVEFFAYIVFAAVCFLCSDLRSRASAMIMMAALGLVIVLIINENSGLYGNTSAKLARCMYSFGIGVAVLWLTRVTKIKISGSFSTTVQIALALLVISALSIVSRHTLSNIFMPLIFGCVVFSAACDQGSRVKTVLETPMLRRFGELSYSIYMVHMPILLFMVFFVSRRFSDRIDIGEVGERIATPFLVGDAISLAYIAVVVGVAVLTHKYIEVPGRTLGRHLAERRRLEGKATEATSSTPLS